MTGQKCYTGTIVAKRDVTVFANSPEEAADAIRQMHESGDACAELGASEVTDIRESDEDGNEFLNAYLFFDDESATLFELPVLTLPANTTELTDEMVREILEDCLHHSPENAKYLPLVAGWDRDKMADAMWELCCLIMNSVALIHPKHAGYLESYGNELAKDFGDDSSTYRACRTFNEMLKQLAVRVIPFPIPDFDQAVERDFNE